jgi:acylaminoacyl-peptidase
MRQYLLLQGYCLLIVNFSGSIGYGGNFLNSLTGNIGVLDVEDCGDLTQLALEKFSSVIDPKKIAAYGGSHGGFLGAWLVGHLKYKHLWATAVVRNPVLDMNYMRSATDIPDWIEAYVLNRSIDLSKLSSEDV